MDRVRAIEIIEAYGGYPAQWPDDERAPLEALAATDAGLRAKLDDAREIDRVLRDWSCELLPATEAEADAAASAALAAARRSGGPARRWLPRAAFGGALAASLAIGAIMLSRPDAVPTAPVAQPDAMPVEIAFAAMPGESAEAAQDMLVWASVFTPTPDEETVL